MWKFVIFSCLVAVCASQLMDLTIICKYVSVLNCNLFANHPVCGSNNITYDNHCLFSKAHCFDRSLHVKNNGTCSSGSTTGGGHGSHATYEFFCKNLHHSHCGTDVEMVCGSDGRTYDNFCLFEKTRCYDRELYIREYNACD